MAAVETPIFAAAVGRDGDPSLGIIPGNGERGVLLADGVPCVVVSESAVFTRMPGEEVWSEAPNGFGV